MEKYELAVIFKPLEDETVKSEFEKVQELVTRFGGEIEKVDEWGKRRLAYEINKITEGVYYFVTFASETGAIKEIEGRLRIFENVIRYLIVRQDSVVQ